MLMQIDALSIVEFHDGMLALPDWPGESPDSPEDVWEWIAANHRFNCLLWHEEDRARRVDVDATEIAASKRLIDCHNQQRNDAVEAIDDALLSYLSCVERADTARLSSETAGAMIDRLSLLSLKVFHMRQQTRRGGVGAAHVDTCCGKLQRLLVQRNDLACCLDQLLTQAQLGIAYFKVYRQFRLHNDPSFYPDQYDSVSSCHPQ